MAFLNPSTPNLVDFAAFVANQGVPPAALPSGSLTTISISTSGTLTAASSSGSVAADMVLAGSGIPGNTYITAWSGESGTVMPAPAQAISAASAITLSPYLQWAFTYADSIALIPPANMPAILYVMAVYNLGMHQLLKIAQDQPGQCFFCEQRKVFKLLSFIAGPVISTADQATSTTLAAPDFLKGLTISDLDLLKSPWGQAYLGYAQSYGPNLVGVS